MLESGLSAAATLTVGPDDLAPAHRSGDVPVLATPRVAALCEEATVAAVAGLLEAGDTTVGTRVVIEHHSPSLEGAEIRAVATLEAVEGRRLLFRARVTDRGRHVAGATIGRVVVDRQRFLDGAQG